MMADKPHPTTAPHSSASTSPPYPPYTPRSTSIPDDSETEFEPTPLHSPGGPQYEDLPPSYDFALSDARNGVASLDASQIEAHRVSANEGPDEPEVWEYRMRGGAAEEEGAHEREEAPAYEGHVRVQHVASSESILVGRVGDSSASITSVSRGVQSTEDPPHSLPDAGPSPSHEAVGGRGGHHGQPWTPFGAPGCGPFGAPGNGPFGAPGNGPFGAHGNGPFGAPGHGPFGRGRGFGQRGCGGRTGRGRGGRGARFGSPNDWAAFGQNMGRWGEEFGRQMGNLGEQLGRQAGAMGEQFGRQAGSMGEHFGRQAGTMGQQLGSGPGAWAAAYSGSATGAQTTSVAGPSNRERSEPPQHGEPPSYQGPTGVAGQETGVLHSDRKVNPYPPEKASEASSEKPSEKTLGKQKVDDYDDDDDSSISSDSTDSSSSSDSEDDYDDAQAAFLNRIDSINKAAESAAANGEKSREEIEHERDLAIEKATREREGAEVRIACKKSRRTQKRELRNRKRELMREYRQKKRDLKAKAEGKGKGKGKAKKGTEWKELRGEYKVKRRALKRERLDAKRAWNKEKRERKRGSKEGFVGNAPEQNVLNEKA